MITLFRNIRHKLLSNGSLPRYLLYAIGEIALVVIGILIALQIDTWNDERKSQSEEKAILANLNREFMQNKEALNAVLDLNGKSYESGLKIMELIGGQPGALGKVNTDSLIFKTVDFRRFTPSENALSDLIQSGRLQLLQNETLKDLLYDWSRVLKKADDNFEGYDDKVERDLIPYLTTRYPLKDIDIYGELQWKTKSSLQADKFAIFGELEYENLMDDLLYRLLVYRNDLTEAGAIIDGIIAETEAL
ncbi:DUF6090 family protein [Robiginitalea sp. IMCC43444]|uniref:DUF6090 family protein n=1 Tax=Robiginitalea sp. IMCC43444 TaxID=3459121 RepID=UPI0040419BF5